MKFPFGKINSGNNGKSNWTHWQTIFLRFKKRKNIPNGKSNTVGNELRFSRLLDAPIRLVWDVWVDPEHIKNWWGPAGFLNTIKEMDLRPGAEWILVMHGPDGRNYDVKCIFREIVKYTFNIII